MTARQRLFAEHYVRCLNATKAALAAGYSARSAYAIGSENLRKPEVAALIAELLPEEMSRQEVGVRLSEQARADMGSYFKIVEMWTDEPLPSHEPVLDEFERPITKIELVPIMGKPEPVTFYRVRKVVVDTARMVDPQYSRLVSKFQDSPKFGLSLELHSVQGALIAMGKAHKMFVERAEVSGANGEPLLADPRAEIEGILSRIVAAGTADGVSGQPDSGAAGVATP
jgi:phage terminase small subunit